MKNTALILALALASAAYAQNTFADSTTVHSTRTTTNPDGSKVVEETTTTKTVDPAPQTATTTATTTTGTTSAPTAPAAREMDEKADFTTRMRSNLANLNRQMEDLKSQAATASSDAKASLDKRMADLEKKRTEINAQLDQTTEQSGRAWTQFRAGLQKSVTELQAGFNKAKKEFTKKEEADERAAKTADDQKKAKK